MPNTAVQSRLDVKAPAETTPLRANANGRSATEPLVATVHHHDDRLVYAIEIAAIRVGERHRRLHQEDIDQLTTSIGELGLKMPIHVRRSPEFEAGEAYVLIAGHSRLSACLALGWTKIDALHRARRRNGCGEVGDC